MAQTGGGAPNLLQATAPTSLKLDLLQSIKGEWWQTGGFAVIDKMSSSS